MSKKTWTTILIVLLVVAAAVAIYYLTKDKAPVTPEPVVSPVVDVSPEVIEETPTDTPSTGGGSAKSKVTIWHTFTEGQEAYLQQAVAGFNAQSETATVELLQQPFADFLKTVNAAVIEGIGPDIIFNYASEAAQYVRAGQLADLSQYIYDEQIGIEGFDSALTKGVLEGEVLGFEDGQIHYLPAYTTGPILFYNKTLFDELGLAVPTTWAEMEAAARKIYQEKGIAGLGTDSLTDTLQMLIMETEGAGYIDVANKQVLFDTPEVRAKVQWLVDLAKEGVFAVKPTGDYFSIDFNSGIIGSYVGSSAGFPYITPDGFEFAMAPMPAETWYPSWNRGPIVFYYKDDARAEAAYEFVKYFISPEINAGWAQAVVALAPYSWTQEQPAYQAYIGAESLANDALAGVQANLDKAGSLPAVMGANVVRNVIRDAILKATGGEMTADEAWTEAVTKANAALKGE